ncbi:hypothetical protein KY339_04715 [Candidatus Woesearchaeota archaeon]|nr:hypothetical protein [Candidatus Woesearchaeota archaeon]
MELSLEQGIKETIRLLEQVEELPILAAVYGWVDTGKSILIDEAAHHFRSKGYKVAAYTGELHPNTDEALKHAIEQGKAWDMFLFHCGSARDKAFKDENPDILAKRIGKKIHLSIGINNPNFHNQLNEDYDLIISNPNSKRKPPIHGDIRSLVEWNIVKMSDSKEKGMEYCIINETAGETAGEWEGFPCREINFYYFPKKGEIRCFGKTQDVGSDVPRRYPKATFRIACDEGGTNKRRIVDLYYRKGFSKALRAKRVITTDIAREVLKETIKVYNERHGFKL